jgi:hypothetical protein
MVKMLTEESVMEQENVNLNVEIVRVLNVNKYIIFKFMILHI